MKRLSSNQAATKRDIAAYLGVTVRTAENQMREGALPFYRIGKLVRFDLDQVKETLAAGAERSAA